MRGSIKDLGEGRFLVRVYLGFDETTGKQKQKTFRLRNSTRKQADKELRKFLTQLDKGTYREPTKLTVGQFLADWLRTTAKLRVNSKTLERYTEIITKDLIPNLGSIELQKLTPADIRKYYAWASEHGRKHVGKNGKTGLSKTTLLQYHRILHKALEQAVEDEIIISNPVKKTMAPVPDDNEAVRVITRAEANRLLEMAKTCKYRDCWDFALYTGCRRGEVLGAKWSDIDLDKQLFRVARSLSQVGNEIKEKAPKTHSGRRAIKLLKITIELLKRVKAEQAQNRLFLGNAYNNNDYVFCETDGTPFLPENLTHSFMHYRDEANLNVSLHEATRHTHASWLLAAGIHPKVVSERLGHSSVQITLDIYSHLLPHIQDEAVKQLEAMLEEFSDIIEDIQNIA